jgi:hypothetical protein
MANPTLYKKVDNVTLNTTETTTLTAEENTQVQTIVTKFFELFEAKHIG